MLSAGQLEPGAARRFLTQPGFSGQLKPANSWACLHHSGPIELSMHIEHLLTGVKRHVRGAARRGCQLLLSALANTVRDLLEKDSY